jgi:hypothetical protein
MRMLHRWLRPGERILWHGMANRGREDTRPVGGRLFVTDQRLYFKPAPLERFAEEVPWEAPATGATTTFSAGPWRPRFPLFRKISLRHRVRVELPDGDAEDFRVTRLGEALVRLARGAPRSGGAGAPSGGDL